MLLWLTLPAAWLLTEGGLYARNTLRHHPEWGLGKLLAPLEGSMGARECARTRNLLAGNRLNLAAWHGFQEVLLERGVNLQSLRFRFWLDDQAMLYVILSKNPQGSAGVRLSRWQPLSSGSWRADPQGGFTSWHDLALHPGPGWHTCVLSQTGTDWTIALDAGPASSLGLAELAAGTAGFLGSYAEARVDDVEVQATGEAAWHEDFRHSRPFWGWLGTLWALLWLASVLLSPNRASFFRVCTVLLAGTLLLACGCLFDLHYWSSRYHAAMGGEDRVVPGHEVARGLEGLENVRLAAAAALEPWDPAPPTPVFLRRYLGGYHPSRPSSWLQIYRGGRPEAIYLADNAEAIKRFLASGPLPARRVLFLGTSQTWGVGARRRDERLVAQVARALGEDVLLINAARCASVASELVARYEDRLLAFHPILTVVNLGNNDSDLNQLGSSLGRLYELNAERGIRTLLLLEANAAESNPRRLLEAHRMMLEQAAVLDIPCEDLHGFLSSERALRSGILWIDFVHLSSHGQRLAAHWLAGKIASLLRKGPLNERLSEQAAVDFGAAGAVLHVRDGFYPNEDGFAWSEGRESVLSPRLAPSRGPYSLQLLARRADSLPSLTVTVVVNGREAGELRWEGPGFQLRQLELGAGLLRRGSNEIRLRYSAVAALSPADARRSSLCIDWIALKPGGTPGSPE